MGTTPTIIYEDVNDRNLRTAISVQKSEWPTINAIGDFITHIEQNVPNNKNWIATVGGAPAGITGVYTGHNGSTPDADTIWLDWFCLLPQFRGQGLGHIMLRDTIEYCKNLQSYKYLRADTDYVPGSASMALYEKTMDYGEKYTAEDTDLIKHNWYIYTKNLGDDTEKSEWGNKPLALGRHYGRLTRLSENFVAIAHHKIKHVLER